MCSASSVETGCSSEFNSEAVKSATVPGIISRPLSWPCWRI
ncbi:Uncharacterised protein [Mycobacteroides abscessus subsp. abscessus]|nr:Uncharacterised protein [Mycobacteroides abscessus subsp. abscessus]